MKKLHLNDIILNILIILLCISVPICLSVFGKDQKKTVVVSAEGKEACRMPLDKDDSFEINGVRIEVKDGKAYVSESDCPDRLCTDMKKAERNGDSIVCVPNKVSVKIVGDGEEKGVDAVAG
ncbi:MAG: NusG domain II-containing protein [Ruminococcaceae bacterium]|nr:NusG domain II-containing protein [Oscillospiraceae bacterium]